MKWKRPKKLRIGKAIREHDSVSIVHYILRLLVIVTMVIQFFNGNYENVFLCVLTLLLFAIPSTIETNTRIDIPDALENIILFFIYAAAVLGEMQAYYTTFPFWDTMLHALNGILTSAIGFSLVSILNKNERFKFQLSPLFLTIVAFCFSMTIGVFWEFYEFFMDMVFGTDMQKDTIIHVIHTIALDPTKSQKVVTLSGITEVAINGKDLGLGGYLDIGLIDTMKDLFVNFLGALGFSIAGYLALKHHDKKSFVNKLIPTILADKMDGDEERRDDT